MQKKDFTFLSADHRTLIHCIEWKPDTDIKAVLQIAHGMVEFINRYDRFATYLANHNILVVGNDHLGHGDSVINDNKLGYFGEDGNQLVISDMHTLHLETKMNYPDVPYFILGHSMGSFLTRQYIEMYSQDLSGAILMGTGYQPNSALKLLQTLCLLSVKQKGWDYRNEFLTKLTLGSYNKPFEPARTKNDWLTKDETIVDEYNKNPLNNFTFTNNAYYYMAQGIQYANDHLSDISKNLPILLISGANDPVGKNGLGVKKIYDLLLEQDIQDVSLRLYQNDRHEILNETNYKQVYQDIYDWMVNYLG